MHQGLEYTVECRADDGTVRWSGEAPNTLTSKALSMMLGSFFRNEELPGCFYMGLSSSSLGEGLGIHEPSANYERAQVDRSDEGWSTVELSAPEVVTLSKAREFKNTSDTLKWDRPISVVFLSTEPVGGEILSYASLKETVQNGPRSVFPGDTILVSARASLQASVE